MNFTAKAHKGAEEKKIPMYLSLSLSLSLFASCAFAVFPLPRNYNNTIRDSSRFEKEKSIGTVSEEYLNVQWSYSPFLIVNFISPFINNTDGLDKSTKQDRIKTIY
ncbi:hypothetical protein LQZ19_05145 [Treponema primitia]|uniref:hypothetical protein n=1 Tax=Treponema primitia TaxID=88058 RepID=UPI00397F7EFE